MSDAVFFLQNKQKKIMQDRGAGPRVEGEAQARRNGRFCQKYKYLIK